MHVLMSAALRVLLSVGFVGLRARIHCVYVCVSRACMRVLMSAALRVLLSVGFVGLRARIH